VPTTGQRWPDLPSFLLGVAEVSREGLENLQGNRILENPSRFFCAGSASLTRAGGAGLGLYVTRSLVELHGGRVWFDSELDKGSTFYVTFPVAAMADDE
jgi:signal transduction histidine kinase